MHCNTKFYQNLHMYMYTYIYVLHSNIPLPWHTMNYKTTVILTLSLSLTKNNTIKQTKTIWTILLNFLIVSTHFPKRRYQILNPKDISGMEDPKKCSKILIESTALDPDLYRLGHTKAWFLIFLRECYTFKQHMCPIAFLS